MENVVTFQDILKSSFLDADFVTPLTTMSIALNLLATFIISFFIFYMYKKTFQGVLYTRSFNVSLVMISLITTLVIMTISSNIILSLGMVGALSIVRFRTAIKDSMDIVFMFWAISIGIANGAGYFQISIVGSLFVGVVLILMTKLKVNNNPYLLILKSSQKAEGNVMDLLKTIKGYNIKSKAIVNNSIEITVEFRLTNDDTKITNDFSAISGVDSVVLVKYDGDYVS
jgi:uncharacterized membrane protein YhiD involved in acid resistance